MYILDINTGIQDTKRIKPVFDPEMHTVVIYYKYYHFIISMFMTVSPSVLHLPPNLLIRNVVVFSYFVRQVARLCTLCCVPADSFLARMEKTKCDYIFLIKY